MNYDHFVRTHLFSFFPLAFFVISKMLSIDKLGSHSTLFPFQRAGCTDHLSSLLTLPEYKNGTQSINHTACVSVNPSVTLIPHPWYWHSSVVDPE